MANKITAAIAATEAQPVKRLDLQIGVKASGRQLGLTIPVDVEPADLFALIGFITNQLPKALASAYLEEQAASGKALQVVQALPQDLSMPGRA